MTFKWQNDEKGGYPWAIAGGVGFLSMVAMIGVGRYSDTTAVFLGLLIFVLFGLTLDWAFSDRDPEAQMNHILDTLTPKKLLTNEEIFGKGSIEGETKRWKAIVAAIEPKTLLDSDAYVGKNYPEQAFKMEGITEMLTPKSLMTYDQLMSKADARMAKPVAKVEAAAAEVAETVEATATKIKAAAKDASKS